MKFLLLSLTAAFSLSTKKNAPFYPKPILFSSPKQNNYLFPSFKFFPFFTYFKSNNAFSNWSHFYALDQMFIYEKPTSNNQQLNYSNLKKQNQKLNFEQQEQSICSAIEKIFDTNDTSTVTNVIQTIQHNENIYEKYPEIKKILNEQQHNPNMKKFYGQIKALPEDKLPPKIVEKRNQLEKKIQGMSTFEKAKYLYKLSKKFNK